MCSISEAVNFSPCLIMRLLLEHLELGLSKEVGVWRRNMKLIYFPLCKTTESSMLGPSHRG